MKRRLTIARSLVNRPEILLLRRADHRLDPQARTWCGSACSGFVQEGVTLVLDHALHGRGRAAVRPARWSMDDGRIAGEGSPAQLIAEHSSARSSSCASTASTRASPPSSRTWPSGTEVLPDRLLLYTKDGEATVEAVAARGCTRRQVLIPPLHAGGRLPPSHGRSLID
jgi:lipooligosaccharide transport system ATP-binding protein